jgi:Xaa-Pro aminopeptidase
MFDEYRDFGSIRIEDDLLVTRDNCHILGYDVAKTLREIES